MHRFRNLICLAVVGASLSACGANVPKTKPAARSEASSAAQTSDLAVTAVEKWRLPLPGSAVGLPYVDAERIVVTTSTAVVSVARDGRVQWSTPITEPRVYAPRADADLLFAVGSRSVAALRAATGELVWEVEVSTGDNKPLRPAVDNGIVVVATSGGRVVGLDRATGATRWSNDRPTELAALPAAHQGVAVIVGIAEWAGLDVATGAVLWSGDLGLIGTSSPVAYTSDGEAWVSVASDEKLITVGLRDGRLRWQSAADQSELPQVPIISQEGELLVPDHWGRLAAYKPSTGEKLWSSAGADGVALFGEPVELGRRLVALPLGENGPRLASDRGAVALRTPSRGIGVAALSPTQVVVSTWGDDQNYLLAYDLDLGREGATR